MENRKDIVLVPFDFTEIADYAVDHAAGIAKKLGWEVRLVHIINKDTRELLNVYKVTDEIVNQHLQERADIYLKKYGVSFSFEAREGSIFTDIAKAAEDVQAKLAVMGTHGKSGVQHIVGSYAHKVITSSRIPFITVQKKLYGDGYKKVVVPIDDTLESRQKIKWTIYMAQLLDLKVYVKGMYLKHEVFKARLMAILDKIVDLLEKNNIKYEAEFIPETGNFVKQTLDYARKVEADLIMIMTSTEPSLVPNFIINPWDEQILFNDDKIPVMAINPRDLNIFIVGL
ncbi:MAG: universal stress protein [Bacteroidales bacterium]|nr:universal stress protein [Bacteroidales bacterium]